MKTHTRTHGARKGFKVYTSVYLSLTKSNKQLQLKHEEKWKKFQQVTEITWEQKCTHLQALTHTHTRKHTQSLTWTNLKKFSIWTTTLQQNRLRIKQKNNPWGWKHSLCKCDKWSKHHTRRLAVVAWVTGMTTLLQKQNAATCMNVCSWATVYFTTCLSVGFYNYDANDADDDWYIWCFSRLVFASSFLSLLTHVGWQIAAKWKNGQLNKLDNYKMMTITQHHIHWKNDDYKLTDEYQLPATLRR